MKNLEILLFKGAMICALAMLGGKVHAQPASPPVDQTQVTAIDIALEPDATMLQQAQALNARLRSVYPKGFALDASHPPHITLLQRFVRTADLNKVYSAAARVLADANVTGMKLKALKFDYRLNQEPGLADIVVEPTPELIKLQQDLIDAVAPFTAKTGTAAAFLTTPEDPIVHPATIDAVASFVPKASGKNFNPHLAVGSAARDYLKTLRAEPFEAFTFSLAGASAYHLGSDGMARKQLLALVMKL
jgi:hypothetical protein